MSITKVLEPDQIQIETYEGVINLTLLRSSRAKRMSMRARPLKGDIALTLPYNIPLSKGISFAQSKQQWLLSAYNGLEKAQAFEDGVIFPFRGIEHQICSLDKLRGKVEIYQAGENNNSIYPQILVPGGEQHVARRLKDWLKEEAKRDLCQAVQKYALRAGVKITAITVRDTSTRWGSCSSNGKLSFSWRLIMAPPFVLHYLAAHEVAHRREMNHSKQYWDVVAQIEPDYQRAEYWLKNYGKSLHLIGV